MFSPGVRYLSKALVHIVFPAVVAVHAGCYVLGTVLDVSVQGAVKWLCVVTVIPLSFVAKICYQSVQQRRQARSMGAALVPTWQGRLPGNYDVLRYLVEKFQTGYIAEPFWAKINELGPIFNLKVFWVDQLFTIEPEHVKQILATEFNSYEKGADFQGTVESVLGTGVFNSDGEMWRFHRSMTRPFFSRDRISDFAIFAEHADAAVAQLRARLAEGVAVDVQDAVGRYTLDSATAFLFGACVHSLDAGLPHPSSHPLGVGPVGADAFASNKKADAGEDKKDSGKPESAAERFLNAFAQAQYFISVRTRLGPMWQMYELRGDKTRAPMAVVNGYLEPILAEALRKKREQAAEASAGGAEKGMRARLSLESGDKDQIDEEETLLDHLVRFTDDPVILKDETLNILIAGRDTTASLLTFVVYILALYPGVMERLRAEVLNQVGPTRHPTLEDIREMKYMRAVLNETLRLYPPVPFNVRASIDATTLAPTTPGGKPFYVPPRTSVSYSVFMMHRRTDLWGPDAHEFDPDRFLDERVHKYLTPNPFIFLPFNAGPRICLGQQFAYNESSFMLVRLLQSFDAVYLDKSAQPADSHPPAYWRNMPGRQSVEESFLKCHLTMYAHKGMWVKLREARKD